MCCGSCCPAACSVSTALPATCVFLTALLCEGSCGLFSGVGSLCPPDGSSGCAGSHGHFATCVLVFQRLLVYSFHWRWQLLVTGLVQVDTGSSNPSLGWPTVSTVGPAGKSVQLLVSLKPTCSSACWRSFVGLCVQTCSWAGAVVTRLVTRSNATWAGQHEQERAPALM